METMKRDCGTNMAATEYNAKTLLIYISRWDLRGKEGVNKWLTRA